MKLEHLNDYHKYYETILKYKACIVNTGNIAEKINIMNSIYDYVKEISIYLYKNDPNFEKNYPYIENLVLQCESLLANEKITDIKSNFNIEVKKSDPISYIVNQAREYIYNNRSDKKLKFDDLDLAGKCFIASNYIKNMCQGMNIKCYKIGLFPGFTYSPILYNGLKQHYFNIIDLNNEFYLVDITYSQFFKLDKNILNRIGAINFLGCSTGIFMNMTGSRKNVANNLLEKGFIKIENEVMKDYLDGFALSYRNGLYYETTNDYTFKTNYSNEDYLNFLIHNDNQINHENEKFLDIQKIPITKKLKF